MNLRKTNSFTATNLCFNPERFATVAAGFTFHAQHNGIPIGSAKRKKDGPFAGLLLIFGVPRLRCNIVQDFHSRLHGLGIAG